MKLLHCMSQDWFWIGLLLGLCLLNSLLYFEVFRDALKAYKQVGGKGQIAKAFLSLAGVFAFCAGAGYLTDWLGLFIPHYRVKVILLIPLVGFTAYMVYSIKRTGLIEKMFSLEKRLEEVTNENEALRK